MEWLRLDSDRVIVLKHTTLRQARQVHKMQTIAITAQTIAKSEKRQTQNCKSNKMQRRLETVRLCTVLHGNLMGMCTCMYVVS